MKSLFICLILFQSVLSDFFLHNPRGSNGRLNEANTNRNNANRLFDSQNNAKGGYCIGPAMSYYEGSLLQIEFDPTHGVNNPRLHSNFVIQYMCSDSFADQDVRIRDGSTTDTILLDANGPQAVDANGDPLYGMHEPRSFYTSCTIRERNKGLWIADRANPNVGSLGNTAVSTRQNNNGNRHAYECPEERDYYPYWHPSPWKDIAVLTDSTQFCQFYQSESQNVKPKSQCVNITGNAAPQNMQASCLAAGNYWQNVSSWAIPPPECLPTTFTRDNSAGISASGRFGTYTWKLPTVNQEPCIVTSNCNCVLRMRYNVSSGDMGPGGYSPNGNFVDWNLNGPNSPIQNRNQDPAWSTQDGNQYQLAIDTSQTGRVFQDRSHMFHIKPRPSGNTARIYNLNVKGKRGNPVQVFPAVEYGFSPDKLTVNVGDYVHFQWTGCDTNPLGNNGEGTQMTDRSNIVQIQSLDKDIPALTSWIDGAPGRALLVDVATRNRFAYLDQTNCLTYSQLNAKNNGNQDAIKEDVQNCMKLNSASRYFDGGLVQLNSVGDFFYLSTRNNRPGIQSQKGSIRVIPVGAPTNDPMSSGQTNTAPSSVSSGGPSAGVSSGESDGVSGAISLFCGLWMLLLLLA